MDIVVKKYLDKLEKIKLGRNKIVDIDTYNDRLDICKSCNYYEKYNEKTEVFRCSKCGCAGYNIILKNYQCPLKPTKWRK